MKRYHLVLIIIIQFIIMSAAGIIYADWRELQGYILGRNHSGGLTLSAYIQSGVPICVDYGRIHMVRQDKKGRYIVKYTAELGVK